MTTQKNFLWPNGSRVAVSVVVNIEEASEMSVARGDKRPDPVDELGVVIKAPVRNYGNESNYLYGLQVGADRVFDLIDRYQIPTTVTAAAQSLEACPDLAQRLGQSHHDVAAHGYRWIHQFHMDEQQEREFIAKATASITQTTGVKPKGWLSRYMHTAKTHEILVEQGYLYHMDNYSSEHPFRQRYPKGDIVVVPYALDTNDMKMWIDPAYTPDQWAKYVCDSLDWMLEEEEQPALLLSIGVHLRIVGRPGRMAAFRRILDHIMTKKNMVWCATRHDIAHAWSTAHL